MRSWMRRVGRGALATVVACAGLAALAPSASAALSELPDDTWMTNGTVYSVIRSGSYVYVAGQFTRVRSTPPGVPGPGYKASGVARFDATTGAGDKTWAPIVTRSDGKKAKVFAVAAAGGKIWIGGKFDRVDGAPRLNFAALDETTGALDPNVTAAVGNDLSKQVRTLLASEARVYAGGTFNDVDGIKRKKLAAFDLNGNLVGGWKPRAAGKVWSLAFDCTGDTVLAAGVFEKAAGSTGTMQVRDSVARFDAMTGALHAYAIPDAALSNGLVGYDLALSCAPERLFVGFGGQNFIFAFDFSDDVGDVIWSRQSSGNVQTVAVRGNQVLFGGHFSGVNYPTGTCTESKPKLTRFAVADLDGNCDLSWKPSFEGKFWGPWDILLTDGGSGIWVVGQFTIVSDQPRYFVARFTDA